MVNGLLGLVFERPTIGEQASEIEHLRQADLGVGAETKGKAKEIPYAQDVDGLVSQLPRLSRSHPTDFGSKHFTLFLTAATGLLGAFVLRDLPSRNVCKVITLFRAKACRSSSGKTTR